MTVRFLGQAGLLFETDGRVILIDPYLSDSVAKTQPKNRRRQPVDQRFLKVSPDLLIFTHDHGDHYDEETVKHYLAQKEHPVTVLAPSSVWQRVRGFGNGHNYVQLDVGSRWREEFCIVRAVKAAHSDPFAIGVVLTLKGKCYYITGDTLYNEAIFSQIPHPVEAVFLPINGRGNNMNAADAAEFSKRIGAKHTVPLHFGLFDNMTGEELPIKNRVIPVIYKEIKL